MIDTPQPDDGNSEIGDGQPLIDEIGERARANPIEPESVQGAEGLPDEVRDGMIDDDAPPDEPDQVVEDEDADPGEEN